MSTSYDKHRDQVGQARQTDGKFGSYSAGESAVTLERHPESAAADEAMRERIPTIFNGPYEDHSAVEKIDSFLSTQPDERIAIRQAVEQLQPDDPYDEEQWETFDDRMDYVAESILDGGLENRDVSQLAADAMDEYPSDSDSGEVTLSSGVTVEVNAEGEAESSSPGTAEDNLIGNGPLAHAGGHELLGNDGFAYNEGINRATKAASEGKIAVVHTVDKYLDDGGDANNNVPTGMEEVKPQPWAASPQERQTPTRSPVRLQLSSRSIATCAPNMRTTKTLCAMPGRSPSSASPTARMPTRPTGTPRTTSRTSALTASGRTADERL